MRISELIERLGGRLEGDGSIEVSGIRGVDASGAGDVTFAVDDKSLSAAEASDACCVIVTEGARESAKALIRCKSPEAYAADLMLLFHPEPVEGPGVHPSAVIDLEAQVDESAAIGPNVVVAGGCRIGRRVRLMASVVVNRDCEVGDDTVIHPNVTIYPRTRIGARVLVHAGAVIGADGFGFFVHEGGLRKWPHVGNVVIADDVEIGANACVDRAKFGSTRVERFAKIDNLVQVAHNCRVGAGSILAAQAGLSGSVVLEEGVVCGGQVGVADHLTLGRGVQVAAQSGIKNDIPPGETVFGYPAKSRRKAYEEIALLTFLAENRGVVKKLIREAKTGE